MAVDTGRGPRAVGPGVEGLEHLVGRFGDGFVVVVVGEVVVVVLVAIVVVVAVDIIKQRNRNEISGGGDSGGGGARCCCCCGGEVVVVAVSFLCPNFGARVGGGSVAYSFIHVLHADIYPPNLNHPFRPHLQRAGIDAPQLLLLLPRCRCRRRRRRRHRVGKRQDGAPCHSFVHACIRACMHLLFESWFGRRVILYLCLCFWGVHPCIV